MRVIIGGEGGGGGSWKANKSPFTATHATLVHELSDNDDG